MLYICEDCGMWIISLGLVEAMAKVQGATITQPCPDCKSAMRLFEQGDRIYLRNNDQPKRYSPDPDIISKRR